MAWTVSEAKRLASMHLREVETRWDHSRAVGEAAQDVASRLGLDETVVVAAWLHDIGYSAAAAATGLHALDGARLLTDLGASAEVVSLVAYHSGAEFEARQRGLEAELEDFARPAQDQLDVLIYADMTINPAGDQTYAADRVGEILNRYSPEDPVHLAVVQSRDYLSASVDRVERRLHSADERLRASL